MATVRSRATVALCAALLGVTAGCANPQGAVSPGLQQAMADYPPLYIYGNVHPTDGHERAQVCPATGGRVEAKGGPTFVYGGADPSDPLLCRLSIDGQNVRAWYGIWLTDWPGADQAKPLLRDVLDGPSGTVRGFANDLGPGHQYYDLMRNEGIEDIWLIDRPYHAIKISHYREGFAGNDYRSVSTVWKDIESGMLIYGTYQHISGRPEIDDPIIPAAIVLPGR